VSRFAWFFAPIGLVSCLGLAEVDESKQGTGGSGAVGPDGGTWPESGSDANGGTGNTDATADVALGGASGSGATGGTPNTIVIQPKGSLAGDGFIASPDLCDQIVWDSYDQSTYFALHVGRDNPCNEKSTYRAFLRFDLDGLPAGAPLSAKLRFHYEQYGDATGDAELFEIEDFGQLKADDWDSNTLTNLGVVLEPSTPLGWIEVDVTSLIAGKTGIAFLLRYTNENEDFGDESRWYGIVAEDTGDAYVPRLELEY
jgi:hypothetical protein